MAGNRRRYFDISPEKLAVVLDLPVDTELYGASWDYYSDSVRLWITHPDFPELEKGAATKKVNPMYITELEERTHFDKWGL